MSDLDEPGASVVVTFDGIDHTGTLDTIHNGWVIARIRIDPAADYGSITERLDPEQTVCVRTDNVRKAAQ